MMMGGRDSRLTDNQGKGSAVIARSWRGWTAATDGDAYLSYLRETGIAEYASTPGNLGCLTLRQMGHERAQFLMISFWDTWQAIERFAGSQLDRAVFYPEDDRFLVARDRHVDHFDLLHADVARLRETFINEQ